MTTSTGRLHSLDALRGFALILGIIFHSTMSFLPVYTAFPWVVMDTHRSLTLAVVFYVLHMFRMSLFFIMAGFFMRLSLHAKGTWPFVLDRLKRIGIPLVVAWPIITWLTHELALWGAIVSANGETIRMYPLAYVFRSLKMAHLWFLYYLLVFYALCLVIRWAISRADKGHKLVSIADRFVANAIGKRYGILFLAVPMALLLWSIPHWRMWFGIVTLEEPIPAAFGSFGWYFATFCFGRFLHRQSDLLQSLSNHWAIHIGLAVLFSLISLLVVGVAPVQWPVHDRDQNMIYAVTYSFAIWAWCFGLIGAAVRFLSDHSPVRKYMADASYWLYLIHLPVVMSLQILFSQANWPWLVKFVLIQAIGFPLMLLSYHFGVRDTAIGVLLNGKRFPRKRRSETLMTTITPAS